jgi:transposase
MSSNLKGYELSIEVKERIIGMRLAGVQNKIIATLLSISESTACGVWKRYNDRGTTHNAKRSGCPRKLTDRDHRSLGRIVCRNRRATLKEIMFKMATPVSICTVRQALHKLGIWNRIAPKKPYLSFRHISTRLQWAKERRNWSLEEWKRVIWTDEAHFEIGKGSNDIRVWRTTAEKWEISCLAPTFKSGRMSVMAWGCMVHGKLGPLLVLPKGRMNGEEYVRTVMNGPM